MASKITDYCAQGLAANRPVTPGGDSTAASFWYSTDTNTLSVYAGSAWHDVAGTVTPAAIVQQKSINDTKTVVMSAAPTQGNLLVAFTLDNTVSETAASGWTQLWFNAAAAHDALGIYYKIAGASESTSQTPLTAMTDGALTVFEISNATPSWLFAENLDKTGTAVAVSVKAAKSANRLVIGVAVNRDNAVAPSSITGATLLGSAVQGGSRTIQPFRVTTPTQGTNTVTPHYPSSQDFACPMLEIG